MVNKQITRPCEDMEIIKIPDIRKEFGKEIEILHKLGVEYSEIKLVIELRIKEETTKN